MSLHKAACGVLWWNYHNHWQQWKWQPPPPTHTHTQVGFSTWTRQRITTPHQQHPKLHTQRRKSPVIATILHISPLQTKGRKWWAHFLEDVWSRGDLWQRPWAMVTWTDLLGDHPIGRAGGVDVGFIDISAAICQSFYLLIPIRPISSQPGKFLWLSRC